MQKVSIYGFNVVLLKSIDSSENLNIARTFLVIDVLYDKPNSVINVVVGTDVVIDLNEFAKSLSQIHATLLNNTRMLERGFSFNNCLCI